MELSCSNIKKFLTFSVNKAFLIFRETETPKKFLFQETVLFYISGSNFPNSKNKQKKNNSEKTSYISENGTF